MNITVTNAAINSWSYYQGHTCKTDMTACMNKYTRLAKPTFPPHSYSFIHHTLHSQRDSRLSPERGSCRGTPRFCVRFWGRVSWLHHSIALISLHFITSVFHLSFLGFEFNSNPPYPLPQYLWASSLKQLLLNIPHI